MGHLVSGGSLVSHLVRDEQGLTPKGRGVLDIDGVVPVFSTRYRYRYGIGIPYRLLVGIPGRYRYQSRYCKIGIGINTIPIINRYPVPVSVYRPHLYFEVGSTA